MSLTTAVVLAMVAFVHTVHSSAASHLADAIHDSPTQPPPCWDGVVRVGRVGPHVCRSVYVNLTWTALLLVLLSWALVSAYAAQLALVGYGAAGRLGQPVPSADDLVMMVSKGLDQAHPVAVRAAGTVARLVTWEDQGASLKALFASVFAAFVGNLFTDMQLLFLAAVAALFAGFMWLLARGAMSAVALLL